MFFKKEEKIFSPVDGKLMPITEAPDQVFSQKIMGDGCCFELTNGEVVSPVDGTITTIFDTKHAIGITSKKGTEMIIHVGMDTVSLGGEGFTAFVKNGDTIKVGDKLLEVDIEKIRYKVPSMVTPLVITNLEGKAVNLAKEGDVRQGELIFTVK